MEQRESNFLTVAGLRTVTVLVVLGRLVGVVGMLAVNCARSLENTVVIHEKGRKSPSSFDVYSIFASSKCEIFPLEEQHEKINSLWRRPGYGVER